MAKEIRIVPQSKNGGIYFYGNNEIKSVSIKLKGPKWFSKLIFKLFKPVFYVMIRDSKANMKLHEIKEETTLTI